MFTNLLNYTQVDCILSFLSSNESSGESTAAQTQPQTTSIVVPSEHTYSSSSSSKRLRTDLSAIQLLLGTDYCQSQTRRATLQDEVCCVTKYRKAIILNCCICRHNYYCYCLYIMMMMFVHVC